MEEEKILELIRGCIELESNALRDIANAVDDSYLHAVKLLLNRRGKVVVTGVGKSGIIARKIASTMSSTGTLVVFLHPAEAMHGDLGIVASGDIVIAIGKSGESEELTGLLPVFKRMGVELIAITANPKSTLANKASVVLHAGVKREACPHDLAPTTSTTVALTIGDALALALMKIQDFQPQDFAFYHPGGRLGKRLLLKVEDLMVPKEKCPLFDPSQTTMKDVIVELSSFGMGILLFSSDQRIPLGILTDGDIRRLLGRHGSQIFKLNVADIMNKKPLSIQSDLMAIDALEFMEKREQPLNVLPVLAGGELVGLVRLHELLHVA